MPSLSSIWPTSSMYSSTWSLSSMGLSIVGPSGVTGSSELEMTA
jgi:hypothetical protein